MLKTSLKSHFINIDLTNSAKLTIISQKGVRTQFRFVGCLPILTWFVPVCMLQQDICAITYQRALKCYKMLYNKNTRQNKRTKKKVPNSSQHVLSYPKRQKTQFCCLVLLYIQERKKRGAFLGHARGSSQISIQAESETIYNSTINLYIS